MEMQSARITISCLGLGFIVGVGVIFHMVTYCLHVRLPHSDMPSVPLQSTDIFKPFSLNLPCSAIVLLFEDRKAPGPRDQLNYTLCWGQVFNQDKR